MGRMSHSLRSDADSSCLFNTPCCRSLLLAGRAELLLSFPSWHRRIGVYSSLRPALVVVVRFWPRGSGSSVPAPLPVLFEPAVSVALDPRPDETLPCFFFKIRMLTLGQSDPQKPRGFFVVHCFYRFQMEAKLREVIRRTH